MDLTPTPPLPPTTTPVDAPRWLELAGHAALDPAQQERAERWLHEMFGDDDVTEH